MRTINITQPCSGVIQYPNSVAFMYSRQPVVLRCDTTQPLKVEVTVSCSTNGGKTHTETRYLRDGYAELDLSRIFQMTARDVDSFLERVDYATGSGRSLAEVFSVSVTLAGTSVLSLIDEIQGLYGALDAAEIYGSASRLRHFVNYPQTVNVWKDVLGGFSAKVGDKTVALAYNAEDKGRCREVSLQEILGTQSLAGPIDITWLYRIQEGAQSQQNTRRITLVPDATPFGSGAYLRWLNRRGEVAYWHFDKAELETSGDVSETFGRFLSGDPSAPENGTYRNSEKRNYGESRRLGLVTSKLSEEEFDELCSLLSSPVVEMLYVAEEYQSLGLRFDGGTATSIDYQATVATDAQGADTIDGGAAAEASLVSPEQLRWLRVNVDGGSQARSMKRSTPKLHDFQISITLIERNTAQL